jgi:phosphoglycerol transferase
MTSRVLRFLLLYVLAFLVATGNWFARHFGRVDLDQILYHLQQSPRALVQADGALVHNGIENCLFAPLAYALVLLAVLAAARRFERRYFSWPGQVLAFMLASAWAVHAAVVVRPPDFSHEDWLAAHYVVPAQPAAPAKKRNLVLIYAESLETAYGVDPLAGLPAGRNFAFPQYRQLPGTGWTIAGIVSTQCGLPLKPLGILGDNNLGERVPHFLPRARCLGDVLRDAGYHEVFLGGAASGFSGKDRFLRQHGYDEVLGRDDWVRQDPEAVLNEWGLNDDALFAHALLRLRTLAAAGPPFNLTLLTIGMHPPRGYLSPSCPATHQDFSDVVDCTAFLVRSFVQQAQAEGLLADTDVVLVGDHLTMAASDMGRKLAQVPARFVYNRILTASKLAPNRQDIDHFDLAPTLLAALGFHLRDGSFGLGCAAIGPVNCHSLAEDPEALAKLQKHSPFYDVLWLPPENVAM